MKSAFLRNVAALAFGASVAMSAHAVDTWTYTGVTSAGAGISTPSTNAASLTTVGAFATNNGTNGITGNWSTTTTGSPSAALSYYGGGGLGMSSDGDGVPNHALDNNGTYTEGVLLNFSSSTILTGVDLGYISGDADISVFRFVGNSAPSLNGTGASLNSMNNAGWQLVGNYANLSADNSVPYQYNAINSGNVGSSWWLITAYNAAYGTGSGLTQGDDYFKLLSLAGTACTENSAKCGTPTANRAPEPATLALTSVALLGLAGLRRRQAKRSA